MRLRAVTRPKCPQILGALILVVTTGVARAGTVQVKMEKLGFAPVVSSFGLRTIAWPYAAYVSPTRIWSPVAC